MSVTAGTPIELVRRVYSSLEARCELGRNRLGRPLTNAEKILLNHLDKPETQQLGRGASYADFRPDRVAMQDATAQMALLQFMTAGLDEAAVPSTVHCDHLIIARDGAAVDLLAANDSNREVYDFLRTVSAKYGIGFWEPGSGIIHQVVLERYAFPGAMMIGTDSHTPNAGGLGMVAVGVGGADAVDVMVGYPFGLRWPKLIGVKLTGELSGWTSPKDIILRLAGILTVKGGTGAIVEYFGDGVESISATGKATICNMGAEIGATCSVFPYDSRMASYLRATGRTEIAEAADEVATNLRCDPEVEANPDAYFDQVIEIDLSTLTPRVVGPHTPDLERKVEELAQEAREKGYPETLTAALVGSCTNSSYEDLTRAVAVARQAAAAGLKPKSKLFISPGSQQIRATIERDGILDDFVAAGATVLANACGPCIGQWDRPDLAPGTPNSIITSFNRNFPKRNDGNPGTNAFIASPEVVVAYAFAGSLAVDPINGEIDGVRLSAPTGDELPSRGFIGAESGFIAPPSQNSAIDVTIAPDSQRLQLLKPFTPWNGQDFIELPVLLKAKGKCTTDHISAAGPWLKFRGHLENISGNLFLGAVNAYNDEVGKGLDLLDQTIKSFPEIAKSYHDKGQRWVAVGDENYGEGSSREHAAMEPRFRGCAAVISRSFARIAETNLKKQGVLPLTFADKTTYDRIGERDRISILGLSHLRPGAALECQILHEDGSTESFEVNHSLSEEHIEWFKAGSALNLIRQESAT